MKKRTKSKKNSSGSPAANQDIAVLLTTLVQKLTSFEAKMDTVLSRIPPLPFAAPRQQPKPAPSIKPHREPRPMHKAICADCKKGCEVPFKPSAGRPVYCKECFATRKNAGPFNPIRDSRPKENLPAQVRPTKEPHAPKPAKPVKKKKQPAKKKNK